MRRVPRGREGEIPVREIGRGGRAIGDAGGGVTSVGIKGAAGDRGKAHPEEGAVSASSDGSVDRVGIRIARGIRSEGEFAEVGSAVVVGVSRRGTLRTRDAGADEEVVE